MNEVTRTIWRPTGNPFVDMGQEMIAAMAGVNRPQELTCEAVKPLLERLAAIYFGAGWNKPLYSMFPNSPLTNPAMKRRKETYAELLRGWLQRADPSAAETDVLGTCAACGRPAREPLSRTLFPMIDAEGGNFQSGNARGTPFCAACALAVQFMPLGAARVGGKFALPHFADEWVQYVWSERCWQHALQGEASGAGGPLEAGTARSVNAFFALIEWLLREAAEQDLPETSITLYLFTNYNQGPEVELHYLPAEVFRFIKVAMSPTLQSAWRRVVRRGYSKLDPAALDEREQLQKRDNQVYQNLLFDRSISGFFVDERRRRPVGNWLLFSSYLKEVQGMDAPRVESLRSLGDRIAEIVQHKKKRLLALERANKKGAFVEQLYRLCKDAMTLGQARPLLTFEELVQDVFPHDPANKYESWREVKWLLLFRVYEVLFDELKDDPEWQATEISETAEEVIA